MSDLRCPLCGGALVGDGDAASLDNSDGTSGPWERTPFRTRATTATRCA